MNDPLNFWNMSLVGDAILDPFGGVNLKPHAGVPDSVLGKIGNAVKLDKANSETLEYTGGAGNGIVVTGSGGFTSVWAWIRRPNPGTAKCYILEAKNDSGSIFTLSWDSDDTVNFFTQGTVTAAGAVSADDEWHLVIGYYDASTDTGYLYIDGVLVDGPIASFEGPADDINGLISFGTKLDRSDNYDGILYVDAVGIAIGELTTEDVENVLWNGGFGREFQPSGSLAMVPSPSLI